MRAYLKNKTFNFIFKTMFYSVSKPIRWKRGETVTVETKEPSTPTGQSFLQRYAGAGEGGPGETAQQLRVLAVLPEVLSLSFRTHTVQLSHL